MKKIKRLIKSILNKLLRIIQLFLVRSSFLSSIYYTFFSKAFYQEHRAVMKGVKKYNDDRRIANSKSSALLRKNIHSFEKGLIMKPRRDVFGTRYIKETVNIYKNKIDLLEKDAELTLELQWAHDVLSKYFEVVGSQPIVDEARKVFEKLGSLHEHKNIIPYLRDLNKSLSVSYDQLYELSLRRRSVRWYSKEKVEREIIDNAIRVANLAPSACNRQPFRYVIVEDKSIINKISQMPFGVKGFYKNIPRIAVLIGQLDSFFDERDRHLIYIDSSLSAMSFLFALESQGISSCVINWPDINQIEEKIKKIIDIKSYERVIMLISFGYPDPNGQVPFSQKKPLDQIRNYI